MALTGGWILLLVSLVLMTLWAATLLSRSPRAGTSPRAYGSAWPVRAPPIVSGHLSLDLPPQNTGLITWSGAFVQPWRACWSHLPPPVENNGRPV